MLRHLSACRIHVLTQADVHGARKAGGEYARDVDVLAYVIGFVVIFVGLAISIALHEIGHLVPAKLFGVRVGQYMIGFGKTLWSRRFGETEYGFKLLPLGGYISMAGMYPPSPKASARSGRAGSGFFRVMVQDARDANDETLEGAGERTFYRLPVWKRKIGRASCRERV